jgi:RNA polymerase sigma-70 factor (ECF subfamily)
MTRVRDRRLTAIEDLYRDRFQRFLQVATAIIGDRESALEAVQDGFADALRNRQSFRGECPLEGWVWRMVVNRALKARRPLEEALPAELPANGNGHAPSEFPEIAALVALLPERQRLAVFLRYYADLDYRSIAAVLEIEVGTVSATLSGAHTALRRALQEVAW